MTYDYIFLCFHSAFHHGLVTVLYIICTGAALKALCLPLRRQLMLGAKFWSYFSV